jgi:putative serine/threonine protein kinase
VKHPAAVPVENLNMEPYAAIVCYPRASCIEMRNRIEELQKHGVRALEFVGKASAFSVPVLGKGYVGVVVVACVNGERVALKMRRVDADRESLVREAELLSKANNVNVGPKFLAVSKDFLLMQLVDGDLLAGWLETHRDKEVVRKVLVDVLEQCWRLDEIGLDHGELSKAPKHLLVDRAQNPFIVDFETASVERKVANVTAVCQFLFAGNGDVAKIVAEMFGGRGRADLVGVLKSYKKDRNRRNFEAIVQFVLGK